MADEYDTFYEDVLKGLGIQPTQANMDALAAVSVLEGYNNRYNPLNSVVQVGNSTPFNSVGVQTYTSFDQGVQGTIALLKGNSVWKPVVAALNGGSQSQILTAFQNTYASWGSHVTFNATQAQINANLTGNIDTGTPGNGGNGIMSDINAGAADLIGTTGQNANAAISAVSSIPDFLKLITTGSTWIRIAFIVLGAVVLLIGLSKITDDKSGPDEQGNTIEVQAPPPPQHRAERAAEIGLAA